MSVVSPPSTNTNVGNAGAGGSVTQLSAIAWTTSNISINTIQSSRLVPTITSGTQRPFSWFHSKKFRVMHVRGVSGGGGGSTAGVTFPNTSSGQNYSYRYDTYSTVQLTCNPAYGYSFSYWAYGNASAPTSGSISGSNPVSIASTDWTTTDYFNIWCVCESTVTITFGIEKTGTYKGYWFASVSSALANDLTFSSATAVAWNSSNPTCSGAPEKVVQIYADYPPLNPALTSFTLTAGNTYTRFLPGSSASSPSWLPATYFYVYSTMNVNGVTRADGANFTVGSVNCILDIQDTTCTAI